jgi:predicted membrane protein
MEKFKKIIIYVFRVIIILLIILILFLFYKKEGFDQFLKLLSVIVWPSLILCALLFFKKTFAYLFFSLEEFNFFGLKGRLKNVQDMINEKAQKLYEEEKRQKEMVEKLDIYEKRVKSKTMTAEEYKNLAEEVIRFNSKLVDDYDNLTDERIKEREKVKELRVQISALLNQISELQRQVINKDGGLG